MAQIAKALRVSAEVLYVRAGILEPSETSQVRDVIITDTAITERQKQILLDIYASFTQQNEAVCEEYSSPSEIDD
ncbi:putative transcriptional regulatory protein [Mycobacterium ulcerans str. Harvey]|uniref:Transcriptional regulatory protein n=1 Tax=Mycobacterium ulcerans str. Harvey TaxID=1299332 RepID=A0ABN0QNB0_MYCUL|nr:putative transcriptional regulatory protein [Mycobacterium ulcerans str. Harvey]